MEKLKFSRTYVYLLDLLFKLKVDKFDTTAQESSGNRLNVISTGFKSDRVIQELTIANDELWSLVSAPEWYELGRIGRELKYGNALWAPTPEYKQKSRNRAILSSLAKKNLVVPTETVDIYIINPFYLRKGDLLRVLHGTAELLVGCERVTIDHIKPVKGIQGTNFSYDKEILGLN